MPTTPNTTARNIASLFRPGPILLDPKNLSYNPCHDVIFPSIISTSGRIRKAADAYYMYYAPHDSPGGICLAHAPALTGPWKEHAGNPLIKNDWPPHYKVGHVSAPHAIWVSGESRLFVYYHGDNDQTHYAVSENGIDFTYGGVALDQSDFADYIPGVYDRVFYGRVYEHCLPSRDNQYIMLVVRSSNQRPHKNGIYLSCSQDARQWSQPRPIAGLSGADAAAWSPCLFRLRDRYYVAYHADHAGSGAEAKPCTDIRVDEFDADFAVRKPVGLMLDRRLFGEANARVADPLVLVEGATVYLVTAIGDRLDQRIALATADVAELERALDCAG